jgi:hypothetical protein
MADQLSLAHLIRNYFLYSPGADNSDLVRLSLVTQRPSVAVLLPWHGKIESCPDHSLDSGTKTFNESRDLFCINALNLGLISPEQWT